MRKLLFPPTVPNSLPAFDSKETLRYYFKPSVTNSMSQIKHLQMVIVKLDTNKSILKGDNYPFEILFKNKSEIKEDSDRGFWYVDIPASIFPTPDVPYKIQIRLGETDIVGKNTSQLGEVLKDLNSMSEWSIVTMVMPITAPDFGIQSFEEGSENTVSSNGYEFNGFYRTKDSFSGETLMSYRYNLYLGSAEEDKKTWTFLYSSGEKFIGAHEQINMSYVFPLALEEGGEFVVTLTIKTKNLYTKTKKYTVHVLSNPALEMFNAINVVPNQEKGQMDISIKAKQILLKPTEGTTIEYIPDEPNHETYPQLKGTHAKIKGSVYDKGDFYLDAKNGVWICQLKAFFPTLKESLKQIIDNPTVEIRKNVIYMSDSDYFIKIKIGAMKVNLAYPTSRNLSPAPEWEYRFVVRKEVLRMERGKEHVILAQNKIIRKKSINPKQEYYFFIKEEQGSMNVDIKETYISSNEKI